jgi:hypothetical protein
MQATSGTEFPTAPPDSFLVVNARYIACCAGPRSRS